MLWFTAVAAAQQPGSLRGLVRDQEFEQPLPGVQVTIVEISARTASSDKGTYVFGQVPPGRYTVTFTKDGYLRQVKADVVVNAGGVAELDMSLPAEVTEMEEYVVRDLLQLGGASELEQLQLRSQSAREIDSVSIEKISKMGASDAAQALRVVPGASLQNGKSAVIRGLPDRYISSQLNGVRLPTADKDKRAIELDQFPAEILESVQVAKTFTPDQQGDSSGGAVNVRLRGVPNEPFFFKWKTQVGGNTQTTGRTNFLSYQGGGVTWNGHDDGHRREQLDNLGENWEGAVGTQEGNAPVNYKVSGAIGGKLEIAEGVRLGGYLSLFYDTHANSTKGTQDLLWVDNPHEPMSPQYSQGTPQAGDFKTNLFDVRRGVETVQWGDLATVGIETENHAVNFVHLYTRTAQDSATLAEDTRGRQYYFPGYNPNDQNSAGFFQSNAAPYLRLETLAYKERITETFQLNGHHKLGDLPSLDEAAPELDWTLAHSTATANEPDKRQFGEKWQPGFVSGPTNLPAIHAGYKGEANFILGNVQHIFTRVEEESDSAAADLKLPFSLGEKQPGYLKFGYFQDRLDRTFDQNTYSNFADNSTFAGPWEQHWSTSFPFQSHPITDSKQDVDYKGKQKITASYGMVDLPILAKVNLIGGVRFESTAISIVNDAEQEAQWFPPSTGAPTTLHPGDADVHFSQHDVLPAIGLVVRPEEEIALRASYSETVARQTFKELSPIQQQEYLGGPIFIGNPELKMSALKNYDLRADWTPSPGSLVSASWFSKNIDNPIEYVQKLVLFNYTTAVNYPTGKLHGYEFEVRQGLGPLWAPLEGLGAGANATFIESRVILTDEERAGFSLPNIQAPTDSRKMTDAPDHLYNLYLTYDNAESGTQIGLFYTITGDTLVAGAGESNGNYVPDVFLKEHDRLNFTFTQKLSASVALQFQAKNLTDPIYTEVYRSPYIGDDVIHSTNRTGIEFSIAIGGEVKF